MRSFEVQDELFRGIHPDHWKENQVTSAAFNDEDLSVDWSIFSTPTQTQSRFSEKGYGVAAITVGFARELNQEVVWAPLMDNKAHSLVKGKKSQSIRRQLARSCTVKIPCD
jgi:hypothetical protein